jgi:rod shape-determining protein MreD
MALRVQRELHIEVHRYAWYATWGTAFLALLLQAFLPKYLPLAGQWLELPLLVTLYFGLSRRNPATGLLLGTSIGLFQDAVSGGYIGLFGIAKAMVGYGASSLSGRIDVEYPISRLVLTFLFFHLHQIVLALCHRLLVGERAPFFSLALLLAAVINAGVALLLFPLLDRLRKST